MDRMKLLKLQIVIGIITSCIGIVTIMYGVILQSSEQREYCDMYCIAVLLYVINNKLCVNCD